ncbi:AAA family ATPase [Gordonia sp. zg691]|uniref:AAA family ATPase n=1 Tax=Gordonia jinghuaiqii TaxID=2758710 RepID=UPI0016627D61|nr:AAA family ATPase [Gordonia jinghuaiqii]MBD0862452.1 AAA family ATPase [Gordonia jinghuaiqii]
MIRLRSATFSNFRGLRNVQIEFATDTPALTVIRAENATGKTSMLYGLTWCLFGEPGLPVTSRRRDTYRISPLDWDAAKDGPEVKVQVAVKATVGDEDHSESYEIIRSATETLLTDGFDYSQSTVEVFKETRSGNRLLENPKSFLELDMLPFAMKDIFFIDGDEALKDYVDSAQDDTRKNVRTAVRSLLGLEILESAKGHLDDVRRQISNDVKNESSGELASVSQQLIDLEESIGKFVDEVADCETDAKGADLRYQTADKQRSEILARGGQRTRDLEAQQQKTRSTVRDLERQHDDLVKQQRALLSSPDLLGSVARETLIEASEIYESLRRDRKIPNTLPELLRERLSQGVCICGASLEPGTDGHRHIESELAAARDYDEVHRLLTELSADASRAISTSAPGERNWFSQSAGNIKSWLTARKLIADSQDRLREIEIEIKAAPKSGDFDAADSRRTREFNNVRELQAKLAGLRNSLSGQQAQRESLRKRSEALQRKETRFRRRLAEQRAVQDMLAAIGGTISVLQDETVSRVGQETNAIFQQLVASSAGELKESNGVVVQEIKLTEDCDIVVRGPLGREIIPSNGLSGAQRRALTIAFILALTKISGESAPLVIDTPLGMTSGTIRRALLENTLRNSQQTLLFLTRDEIRGVEDILDNYSTRNYTMTNTQHSSHAVDPSFAEGRPMEVILCDCKHDTSCNICARKEGA